MNRLFAVVTRIKRETYLTVFKSLALVLFSLRCSSPARTVNKITTYTQFQFTCMVAFDLLFFRIDSECALLFDICNLLFNTFVQFLFHHCDENMNYCLK